jgi:hypothetical protein
MVEVVEQRFKNDAAEVERHYDQADVRLDDGFECHGSYLPDFMALKAIQTFT